MSTDENIKISDEEWQSIVAKFQRTRDREGLDSWDAIYDPCKIDDQVRADLKKLKKLLASCHDRTLQVLDIHINIVGILPGGEVKRGLVSYHVEEMIDAHWRPKRIGGRPKQDCYREAVSLLKKFWPGETSRGAKINQSSSGEYYRFRPYVQWLGKQLRILDPERLKTDNAACLAAWNAIGDLNNKEKSRSELKTE